MATRDQIIENMLSACNPKPPKMPIADILAGIAQCTTDAGHVITSRRYRYQMLMQQLQQHNPNQ